MRIRHLPVFVLLQAISLMFGKQNLYAQLKKDQPSIVVAINKFSGFSEILSIDTLIHDLNVLNIDKRVLYVKYRSEIHTDYIVDVKSQYSFQKIIVKQNAVVFNVPTVSSRVVLFDQSDISGTVPAYSENLLPLRSYEMDNIQYSEFPFYDLKDSGIGFGAVRLTISKPGLQGKPAYSKAVYMEDAAFLIEESLFDNVVSNLFSYFHKQAVPEKSLY
jgi:hypothetical protein